MGSPNNGPFSYVNGSLALYSQFLDDTALSSTKTEYNACDSKADFLSFIHSLDSSLQFEAKRFAKKTSSVYKDFRFTVYRNGLCEFKATKPGNVPGSHAIYVKYVYKDGSIRAVYKDTYDNKGHFVHRHIKWPPEEK